MATQGFTGREHAYYDLSSNNEESYLQSFYDQNPDNMIDIPLPKGVTGMKADGSLTTKNPAPRKATQSIFNRYSLFYYNSLTLGPDPEPYMDKPNRLGDLIKPIDLGTTQTPVGGTGSTATTTTDLGVAVGPAEGLSNVLSNPTAQNLISWSTASSGDPRVGTNAVEYAWEDFLWCKNYGIIPNNYMITLRRFTQPITDDLLDWQKITVPDVSRLISWVDGETNTWESVGLKFSSAMVWKELTSEVQTLAAGSGGGGGGSGCPDPETLIMITEKISIKAGKLKVGDLVWTKHEHTGKWGRFPVTYISRTIQPKKLIEFRDKTNIIVSTTHKFMDSFGNWKKTTDFTIGDQIKGIQGNRMITSIKSVGLGEVMIIEIGDAHTYISNGVISHNKGPGMGNEGAAIGGAVGNFIKSATQILSKPPGSKPSAFMDSQGSGSHSSGGGGGSGNDPYANKNVTYGPLDVIKTMMMRDKGLLFEQVFVLKFEYELRSIDGINPKIAMIDLLSNVMVMTANRGEFWGGDIRHFGGGGGGGSSSGGGESSKTVGPLGDPAKLMAGDYSGYFKSLTDNIGAKVKEFTGGEGLTLEGIGNAAKNIGGNLLSNIMGGAMDGAGGPGGGGGGGGGAAGAQAINSLLTGEETGEWHVMVGNPANPIVSIGNLILEKSEYYLHGALGADDFPTKLTVTCNLKPARPRDRSDMMSMFHRGGRTYTTLSPAEKYPGSKKYKAKSKYRTTDAQAKHKNVDEGDADTAVNMLLTRFPNHSNVKEILAHSAQGIY